jgi:4-hydroxy-tetrahydrodipicolinate synthase
MNHPTTTSYAGVIVPMVTPFTETGDIDRESSAKLIQYLVGHNNIPFVLGTTGEAPSISLQRREVLARILVEQVTEKMPKIAGLLGVTMVETIDWGNKFIGFGVDALVIALPNYYELTQQQMLTYYATLSENIEGNIILYNIPKAIHMSLPLGVIEELSHRDNIIGLKDSELNEERLVQALELFGGRSDFFHHVGVNKLMCKGLSLGSIGIVPSTANLHPAIYYEMFSLCKSGKLAEAEEIQQKTNELSAVYQKGRLLGEALARLKQLMSEQGLCAPYMASPLTCPSQ